MKKEYRRFYIISLAVLLVLFAYLLGNFARTAYPGIENGANGEDDLCGCYEFDECLYMNPLSSFMPLKGFMPYVYGVGEDSLVIANTETGHLEQLPAQ